MKIEQLYTTCLAQGAYYIESQGEVAIIDPLREVEQYIDMAAKNNAEIKYIFETHFHADFVSGHVTLAEKTGAPIIYGPGAQTTFDSINAIDGQEFKLGDFKIVALHTPGHTLESTSYLLLDEHNNPHSLFSGDTLFLGDVGRPDLAQKNNEITIEDLAGMLYNSLRNKIMSLPDHTVIYPAHGAGSACGKNMMKETVDTLGNQKKVNYALRSDMTKEEFISEVCDGLSQPPAYFPQNVSLNQKGYTSIDNILQTAHVGLSPENFLLQSEQKDVIILDVRYQDKFAKSHIPQSIFIGLSGSFAPWVGGILKDTNQKLLLVVDEDKIDEAIVRLSRVGFDQVLGFLKGGIEAWKKAGYPTESIQNITAKNFENVFHKFSSTQVLDVRRPSEFEAEHIENAQSGPLSLLQNSIQSIPKDKFYMHCVSGYRSMIAASILKRNNIHNFYNISDGFNELQKVNIPITKFVCPSTL